MNATEMVGALLEDNENYPGVNNVRRGENLPPRPSTTNSNSSRNTNSVASSSMKRFQEC